MVEGPLLRPDTVTVPVEPGVMALDEALTDTSATRGPTVTDEVVASFAGFGSGDAVVERVAEPPPSVAPGVAPAGTLTGTFRVRDAPGASGPLTVHVIGPASGPAHPLGSEPIVVPVGGEYVTVNGPGALAGPLLARVIVALAVVPGVIVGVATDTERSAFVTATATEAGPELLVVSGSTFADDAVTTPSEIVVPCGAFDAARSGMFLDALAPTDSAPIAHVTGPAAPGAVQPAGRAATSIEIPVGGV